jgi:hypothetical protein
MAMPMVQIGPVFMNVLSWAMLVPVDMVRRRARAVMHVIVVFPIVPMTMLMQHRIMSVDMCMLLAEEDHERDHNNSGSHRLSTGEGLPNNSHR